jgi:hypothetical protein
LFECVDSAAKRIKIVFACDVTPAAWRQVSHQRFGHGISHESFEFEVHLEPILLAD